MPSIGAAHARAHGMTASDLGMDRVAWFVASTAAWSAALLTLTRGEGIWGSSGTGFVHEGTSKS